VHQVTPAVPLGVASRIRTEVQIDVMVTVDVQGRVIGTRVISRKGAAAGLLSNEALKAAQLFRFRPAQDNNRNVQSDMVLTFRFAPTAH
ncbi:MAG: Gram-negative bacterial TonB protein C-terminal, partial [Bryobacterales bacterium]|nr:Gram-negative bacterial TonB protein C-terminal [Bryobacterales bacterium]